MSKMALHHVSYRGRGSLVEGAQSIRYFSVAAPSVAEALRLVSESLGDPPGTFTIARSDEMTPDAGIVRAVSCAA